MLNKDQVKTLIASIKTDMELFQVNNDLKYIDRAQRNLNQLREWRVQLAMRGNETLTEHLLWASQY